MSFHPAIGRWVQTDPEPYVDGLNLYEPKRSNPVRFVDPFGLAATQPVTQPAWVHSGQGSWGEGINKVDYDWSVTDTSAMAAKHQQIGTAGPGIFKLIKVTKADPKCPFDSLHWIQYTVVYKGGAVYTPPGSRWPWKGIDVGGRDDGSPYSDTPAEQAKIDQGAGTGWRGVVKDLYNSRGTDSIFIDWAASGGLREYRHESVAVLIGKRAGKDFMLGALKFVYVVDAAGNLSGFGGSTPTAADLKDWQDAVGAQYPDYVKSTYGGGAR